MKKAVTLLMLLSYCVARSTDETGGVLDAPAEAVETVGDTKSTVDEIVEENLAQIGQQDILDSPVNSGDNTRFLFTTTTTTTASTTTTAAAQPYTQSVDLLLVLNSLYMSAGK